MCGSKISAIVVLHSVSVQTSWDSDYLLGIVSEGVRRERAIYVAPLSSVNANEIPWQRVCRFEDQVVGYELNGHSLLLKSLKNAPHGKLLRVSCERPDLSHAEVIVAETDGVDESGCGE